MQWTLARLCFPALLFPLTASAEGKIVLHARLKPAGFLRAVSEELKGEVHQKGDGVEAKLLTVRIDSFKTGIGFRDDNLKKYLGAEKHPEVTVRDLKGSKGKAKAEIEINRTRKPIDIDYEDKPNQFTGRFTVRVADFGLEPASYLGISTDDEVRVEATVPNPSPTPEPIDESPAKEEKHETAQ